MTRIEWTDATWNPVTGCDRVSPGCDYCYAERMAHRLAGRAGYPADAPFRVTLHPDRLDQPLRWRNPRRVFVNSMSDLFHKDIPADFIAQVWATMAATPQHTYQVLTKRPRRMADLVRGNWWREVEDHATGHIEWRTEEYPTFISPRWLPNVWLGTSIESDRYTFRAEHLRGAPAAVRFLSLEPLLGPLPSLDLTGIDWVIVGGESGAGARPMHPAWVRDIRDRCVAAGVPFFFKQWGAWQPGPESEWTHRVEQDGTVRPRPTADENAAEVDANLQRHRDGLPWLDSGWHGMSYVGKAQAGRELDGRTWDEYPT